MMKSNEKTNTGEGGKGKRGRTVSDDAGGKPLSATSKSTRGQCVGESSTGAKSTAIRTSVNISKDDTWEPLAHLSGSEHSDPGIQPAVGTRLREENGRDTSSPD